MCKYEDARLCDIAGNFQRYGKKKIPGDLVPCPYCGDTNPEIIETGAGFYVRCPRYACNVGWFKFYGSAYAAAKAWNKGKAAGLL